MFEPDVGCPPIGGPDLAIPGPLPGAPFIGPIGILWREFYIFRFDLRRKSTAKRNQPDALDIVDE